MAERTCNNCTSRGRVREDKEIPGDKVGSGCEKATDTISERAGKNESCNAKSI